MTTYRERFEASPRPLTEEELKTIRYMEQDERVANRIAGIFLVVGFLTAAGVTGSCIHKQSQDHEVEMLRAKADLQRFEVCK